MTGATAQAPIFSRGSNVLDYWLLHAEGLVVRPLGLQVEEVIASDPLGGAETLIVRSRVRRRRVAIPAQAIVAVEPSTGVLVLDHAATPRERRKQFRGHVRETVSGGVRWASPRAKRLAYEAGRRGVAGARWLAPRMLAATRVALAYAAAGARLGARVVRRHAVPWAVARYHTLRRRLAELRSAEGRADPAGH